MSKKFQDMQLHHQTIFALVIAFAVVAYWRGVWGLLDIYLFPGDYSISYIFSLLIGVIILVVTNYTAKEFL